MGFASGAGRHGAVGVESRVALRVVITGSRGWDDPERIRARLAVLSPMAVVVVGGARGADSLAEDAAYALDLHVERFPADWERYGKRAGYIRNNEMLDTKPDLVLAFWDGLSPGTAHTIKEAEKRGIPVEVIREGVR